MSYTYDPDSDWDMSDYERGAAEIRPAIEMHDASYYKERGMLEFIRVRLPRGQQPFKRGFTEQCVAVSKPAFQIGGIKLNSNQCLVAHPGGTFKITVEYFDDRELPL